MRGGRPGPDQRPCRDGADQHDDDSDRQAGRQRAHERLLDHVDDRSGRMAAPARRRCRCALRSRRESPPGRLRQARSIFDLPTVATIAPITATPKVPPTIRLIDSTPDAAPAFVRSTAFIAAVLIGDIVRPMPMPHQHEAREQQAGSRCGRVMCDWMKIEAATITQPDRHQRPRTDSVREPTRDRRDDHDHDRRGQEPQAGAERRVVQDVLHVQRQEEELGEHRERDDERDRVHACRGARAEERRSRSSAP